MKREVGRGGGCGMRRCREGVEGRGGGGGYGMSGGGGVAY